MTNTDLATKRLDAAQIQYYIKELWQSSGRWGIWRDRVFERRLHYYNDPNVDPQLGDPEAAQNPFRDVTLYQSDALRKVMSKLIPRLAENHIVAEAKGSKESSGQDALASDLSGILNSWMADIEDRTGVMWQRAMGIGQARDPFSVILWRKADELWSATDYRWSDTAGPGYAKPPKAIAGPRKYRETSKAYLQRVKRLRARQGCPWQVEFPDVTSLAFVFDTKPLPGPAMMLRVMELGQLDYDIANAPGNEDPEGEEQEGEELGIGPEQQAPGYQRAPSGSNLSQTPSTTQWGNRVTVYQLWTRDSFYEMADYNNGLGPQAVKSFDHPYGRVPAEIVPANDTYHPDPVYRWESYLEGIYRQKPFLDRQMTLAGAITEMTALPLIYYESTATGAPLLNEEDGTPVGLTRDSVLSSRVPEGYKLNKMDFGDPGRVQGLLEYWDKKMQDAEPGVGEAQIGTDTAPWSVRLQQTQANVGPHGLMDNQSRAVRIMLNNWLKVHALPVEEGGFGEDLVSWSYGNGKVDHTKVLSVPWQDVDEFTVEVDINPTSSAEQATLAQMLADFFLKGLIKKTDFLRDGMNKPNPEEYEMSMTVDAAAKPYFDKWLAAKIGAAMGTQFLFGQNGQFYDAQGQPATPEQVLQANGYGLPPQQLGPGAPPSPMPQGGPSAGAPMPGNMPQPPGGVGGPPAPAPGYQQPTMPSLVGLSAPGTVPLTGMR